MIRVLIIVFLFSQVLYSQDELTVDAIYKHGQFSSRSVPGFNFLPDGRHYTKKLSNRIISFDIETGDVSDTLFDASEFSHVEGFNGRVGKYNVTTDEEYIVIQTQTEKIYRRSSRSHYFLYDRTSETLSNLYDGSKQMFATLNRGNASCAFVVDNDLYIKHLADGRVERVTNDGEWNKILNGVADWVYEEEFSLTRAFEWNSDGKRLAYIRFDETDVPEFTMTNYNDELYPEYYTFKYPKVGEKLSKLIVKIYNLDSRKTISFDLPNEMIYVPRIQWTSDPDLICVTTMNRLQNHLQLWLVNAANGDKRLLLEEKSEQYIDIHDDLRFLDNGKEFIWASEKNGYNQYYLYDMNGDEVVNLTPGNFDVTGFYGYDEKGKQTYFQAADKSPLTRNIYRSNHNGKKVKLNKKEGWNTARFSSTFDYYTIEHSTINTPREYVLYRSNGEQLKVLESNERLKERQQQIGVSEIEFFDFSTVDGTKLYGYMVKPDSFDESKSYPVFMYLYGGPNSQKAIDQWQGAYYWWFQLLASKGIIVACVDNRGTGARGEEFRKMTYLKLGHYETIDQIAAAEYLGQLSYVDRERIGIFGWSYGGYLSSLCVLKGSETFKMGIAVAPVTNWKWYDAIYTERFMQTYGENPNGYKDNSPVYFADGLKGPYLLVHGASDDNVHMQNSMEMSAALIEADKQFDVYFYPNSNHGIYHGNAKPHLFRKMTDFILENL